MELVTEKVGDCMALKNQRAHKRRPQCLVCGKFSSDRRNLVRHLRNIHFVEPLVRKPQLKCSFHSECSFVCATSEILREHLKDAHNFNVQKKVLNFTCRTDFDKWKQEEEVSTNARYVLYTGTKFRGTKKVYYLKCHRSGTIRSEKKISERKRCKPSKGYTQCGTTCPSSIRVVEGLSGKIQAIYYPVHLGHTLDDESIQYMKLSAKEKEEIVGKLTQGESVKKIVSDARKRTGSKFSRINLLLERDVYNIKKKINFLEKEEDHDFKILDAWVKRFYGFGDTTGLVNPVALYIPADETNDYTLVLVHPLQKIIYSVAYDGTIVYVKTKKGKPNVDFNLTAVTAVCENGDAYPIAFCLSHKSEYSTLYRFFKVLREKLGLIKAQIFVSDNVAQYYLAWKNAMCECENKLICTFDIEAYWEQKLMLLKCPVRKQKVAKSQLKALLHEPDKSIFESNLAAMLEQWESDENMKLFCNFFRRFYSRKPFEWANCYRIHSARKTSINAYLEPINAVLDSIYVESYESLESSLGELFAFTRDTCLLKLFRWDDAVAAEKSAETERNHRAGEKAKAVELKGSAGWSVVEEDDSTYAVRRTRGECGKKCGIACEMCNICSHDYKCTCDDYVLGFGICRHLHAVATSLLENEFKSNVDASRRSAVELAGILAGELASSDLTQERYRKISDEILRLRSLVADCNR